MKYIMHERENIDKYVESIAISIRTLYINNN